jgi:hypothetical protein
MQLHYFSAQKGFSVCFCHPLHCRPRKVNNILCDSQNPEVINTIRREFRKDQYSEQGIRDIITNCKKFNVPVENRLFVVPKNFRMEGKAMLQHAVALLDNPEGLVAIPSKYQDLVTALRSAVSDEWDLDKVKSIGTDLIDSFIMALSVYRFRE